VFAKKGAKVAQQPDQWSGKEVSRKDETVGALLPAEIHPLT